MGARRRIYRVLETAEEGDRLSHWIDLALMVLILTNVTAVVLETVPSLAAAYGPTFLAIEWFSVTVFALEYVLRLWSCTADPLHAHPVAGRLRFARQPMMVIDLVAILPGLLALTAMDLRVLRALRLVRLLRLLKLTRYSAALQVFGRILRTKAPELVSTMLVMFLLLVMASSLMYFIEHEDNPAFDSIPTAMWWGVATLTTVGYGDIYPITAWGRLVGAAVAVLGIGMFAIPAGILGAAFGEEMDRRRRLGRGT